LSPSVSRQINYDVIPSGKADTNAKNNLPYIPVDFRSASYVSDGRFLNATLWLDKPIFKERHSDYVSSNLRYEMLVKVSNMSKPEYGVSIFPEKDRTWTKLVEEIQPLGNSGYRPTFKTLEIIRNYTGFYQDGKGYVDLSLNLGSIGYPDKYWVQFYTEAKTKTGLTIDDQVGSLTVPPGKSRPVYNWPNPFVLLPGQQRLTKIQINFTELPASQILTLGDGNQSDMANLSFNPRTLTIPESGVSYTDMLVNITKNIRPGNYQIPISIEMGPTENYMSNSTEYMNVRIEPPPSLLQQLSDFLKAHNEFTIFIPLIITSVVIFIISRWIDTKSPDLSKSFSIESIVALDASVIVGVLIFLTIGGPNLSSQQNQIVLGILTASIIYPFALSIIRVILKESSTYGINLTIGGFIYLMISIILIPLIQ
jgi:hypothetical protein